MTAAGFEHTHKKTCVSCENFCIAMTFFVFLCRSKGRSDSLWNDEAEIPCLQCNKKACKSSNVRCFLSEYKMWNSLALNM